MQKIAKDIYFGFSPKIGDKALIISSRRRTGNWKFNFSRVKLAPGKYWFQTFTDGQFDWSHGIVDHTGKIIQIG